MTEVATQVYDLKEAVNSTSARVKAVEDRLDTVGVPRESSHDEIKMKIKEIEDQFAQLHKVKEGEQGMPGQPGRHQVDAPLWRVVHVGEWPMLGKGPALDRRERVGPAGRAVEAAAEQQQRVANLFRRQAATVEPPEQSVVRVGFSGRLIRGTGQLIGR